MRTLYHCTLASPQTCKESYIILLSVLSCPLINSNNGTCKSACPFHEIKGTIMTYSKSNVIPGVQLFSQPLM